MILILAEPNDVHAIVVAKRISDLGQDCCILNTEDFPTKCQIHVELSGGRTRFSIRYAGVTIDSGDVKGMWLRRLRQYQLSREIENDEVRRFAYDECREFFLGFANIVPNVINSTYREFHALRKLHQLRTAQEVGLAIPETLVGNDPEAVERFCSQRPGEVIYKVLSNAKFGFYGTQGVTPEKLARLRACELAPTIFQERVPVGQNLRVTMVDERIFAAAIEVDQYGALDWRLDMNPVITAADLPTEVERKLRKLQRALGLRYGAIDLIRTPEGDYVFLEVNPGGQFLFVEIATRQPIAATIAGALCGRSLSEAPVEQAEFVA